ncbi:hypothetical protein CDD83_5952 [Cordyceps sp. RAO-2017]|nr:hypothetical protein CDD83_5952 [Cordyceps sp. RAO-2017]
MPAGRTPLSLAATAAGGRRWPRSALRNRLASRRHVSVRVYAASPPALSPSQQLLQPLPGTLRLKPFKLSFALGAASGDASLNAILGRGMFVVAGCCCSAAALRKKRLRAPVSPAAGSPAKQAQVRYGCRGNLDCNLVASWYPICRTCRSTGLSCPLAAGLPWCARAPPDW